MAERTATAMLFWGAGAWVGIYITAPQPGADSYSVEVVDNEEAGHGHDRAEMAE
jgi:hypothetical protein